MKNRKSMKGVGKEVKKKEVEKISMRKEERGLVWEVLGEIDWVL